ncbi:MAG: prepilin-type N-terminal cleavage/methylation domain-containing protein [Haliea sp.]|nr:prepilin-type N-terminal cleavage/methylation domain-containing protein [Haliea sp.]
MRRARGFTLLEVMLALVLLSMVMVATIAAMRTLGNTQAAIEEVTGRVDEIRVVSQFLRNTIGAAMPVMREGRVGETTEDFADMGTYFWGDRTQLVWVSPLVAGASMGELS